MQPEPDIHDVVEVASAYVWSLVESGRCQRLEDVMSPELVEPVRALLDRFVKGERLTRHSSGDVYEALREPFRRLACGPSSSGGCVAPGVPDESESRA